MSNQIPIKALLAFDAAMQNGSFSIAADKLAVTPGAIGQQVQKLEAWLGTRLFIRSIRQVQPTPHALQYWAEIQPALARIAQASNTLRRRQADDVRISMPPTLAAKWFAPRMADFMSRHPTISLHLDTTVTILDLQRDPIDLAIRYFDGNDPELTCTLLCRDQARLYCAPAYAKRIGLSSPADLVRATLLHTRLHPHWGVWLQHFAQLSLAQVDTIASQHFDQTLLAIEAARHGHGVVLSSALMTDADVRDKTLFEPFPCHLELDKAYYVVHSRYGELGPAAATLKAWLLSLNTPHNTQGMPVDHAH
mgnify:CR=1 FL=1